MVWHNFARRQFQSGKIVRSEVIDLVARRTATFCTLSQAWTRRQSWAKTVPSLTECLQKPVWISMFQIVNELVQTRHTRSRKEHVV